VRVAPCLREIADLHARLARAYENLAEETGIALADLERSRVTAVTPVTQATTGAPARRASERDTAAISQQELADLLNCHPRTVRRMELAGEIPPPIGRGRLKRWRRRDIEQWRDEQAPTAERSK